MKQKQQNRLRSGFTALELIIVIFVLAILAAVLYKPIAKLVSTSKSASLSIVLQYADFSFKEALLKTGMAMPISNADTMNCMDFKGGDDMKTEGNLGSADNNTKADSSDIDEKGVKYYYQEFDRVFRSTMVQQMGFKSSTGANASSGLYLPNSPRNKLLLCSRGAARFLVVTNVEGALATQAVADINGGTSLTAVDGAKADKKAALWTGNLQTFKQSAMSVDYVTTARDVDAKEVGKQGKGNGTTTPYSDKAQVDKMPSVTLTYLLNTSSIKADW